jgi:hypothetical protein
MSDEFTRDLAKLAQALRDEADQCELLGINKPAALLREAAAVIQVDANMQAIDEFAEVTSVGHLSELVDDMRRQLHMFADELEDHEELNGPVTAATLRQLAGDKPPALPLLPPDEPVAWGFPNSAITGGSRWLMLRAQVPADDQYGGAMWVPLYTAPKQAEPLRLDQIAALEAGCGHAAVDWDTRVSLVRAVERVHGIGA